jgi:hypothetical protein
VSSRATNPDPIDHTMLAQIRKEASHEYYLPHFSARPIQDNTVEICCALFYLLD